jgi:hypothetical protein
MRTHPRASTSLLRIWDSGSPVKERPLVLLSVVKVTDITDPGKN